MGKYKHGKQHETLDIEVFKTIMEEGRFVKPVMHRAFLVLLYYIGLRKVEALKLLGMDFTVNAENIHINYYPAKHGIQHTGFILSRSLPYVDVLVERLAKVKPAEKVFPFSAVTAWLIVKRVWPHHYPHFFRLNRVVMFLNDKEIAIDEIRQWMGWKSSRTIDNYLGFSERTIKKLSERLA